MTSIERGAGAAPPPIRALCVGAAHLDLSFALRAPLRLGASNPARLSETPGGVARNVAVALAALGVETSIAAPIGRDAAGEVVRADLAAHGVDPAPSSALAAETTGRYAVAVAPDGDVAFGLAAVDGCEALSRERLRGLTPPPETFDAVFADANLPADGLALLIERCAGGRAALAIDLVSPAKAVRLPAALDGVDTVFCNAEEARTYLQTPAAPAAALAGAIVARGASRAFVTDGPNGVSAADASGAITRPAAPRRADVRDASGAGDASAAAAFATLLRGFRLALAAEAGMRAAARVVERVERGGASLRPADFEDLWT